MLCAVPRKRQIAARCGLQFSGSSISLLRAHRRHPPAAAIAFFLALFTARNSRGKLIRRLISAPRLTEIAPYQIRNNWARRLQFAGCAKCTTIQRSTRRYRYYNADIVARLLQFSRWIDNKGKHAAVIGICWDISRHAQNRRWKSFPSLLLVCTFRYKSCKFLLAIKIRLNALGIGKKVS